MTRITLLYQKRMKKHNKTNQKLRIRNIRKKSQRETGRAERAGGTVKAREGKSCLYQDGKEKKIHDKTIRLYGKRETIGIGQ